MACTGIEGWNGEEILSERSRRGILGWTKYFRSPGCAIFQLLPVCAIFWSPGCAIFRLLGCAIFWSLGCAILLVLMLLFFGRHNWLEENKRRHAMHEWCWGNWRKEGRKQRPVRLLHLPTLATFAKLLLQHLNSVQCTLHTLALEKLHWLKLQNYTILEYPSLRL